MDFLLQAREVIGLPRLSSGLALKCRDGQVWVTCEGDGRDHLLKAGVEYRRTGRGKVVVFALTEASLCIYPCAARQGALPAGQSLLVQA